MKIKYWFLVLAVITPLMGQVKELRGIKLTNVDSQVMFSDANIASAMDYLASMNINTVLVAIWNRGYTYYPSRIMDSLFSRRIEPAVAGRDPLERVLIEAHRNGMEVYPWFEYGFASWYSGGSPPFGGHILQKFPSWSLRTSNGQLCTKNGFDWMSAINPEVQDFMNKLIIEVIDNYDIDGIEFSDRIPAMPVEGGYDSATVAIYKQEHSGAAPPLNYNDANWLKWRGNKMNKWYMDVRNIMKERGEYLQVSTSPSVYPWGYTNYLQDAKGWLDSGICDQFIPQLYRYSYNEYLFELNSAINLVGVQNRDKLFPSILMNIGTGANAYLISADYLLQAMQANRARGAMGEVFFFYEGLRKNNNALGDTIKATFYAEPAEVPGRNQNWRPKAKVRNENESDIVITGTWENYQMPGFQGGIIRTNRTDEYASVEYKLDVDFDAWYDVYSYLVPNTPWTKKGRYVIYGNSDSVVVEIDQSNISKKGWHKITSVFLSKGERKKIVKIDNSNLETGRYLTADAVMLMLNRKLSPDVIVSSEDVIANNIVPAEYKLEQNYPNPFNPVTRIKYNIPESGKVELRVYDMLGREAAELVNEYKTAATYEVQFNGEKLASGVYIYQLRVNNKQFSGKMVLVK
jgi:uncharacterized lipoprotein YddW (UPF0748 family)